MKTGMSLTLEDLLLFLEFSEDAGIKCGGVTEVDLRHFRNVEITACEDFPIDELHPDLWIFSDVTLEDLGGQFDVCFLGRGIQDDHPDQLEKELRSPVRWQLTRVRTVPLKTARGRWQLVSGKLVEYAVCFLHENATWFAARIYYELRKNQWVKLPSCNLHMPNGASESYFGGHQSLYEFHEDDHLRIQLAMGLSFTRQYYWRVRFQISDLFAVYLPVLPQGLKAIFADRDRNEVTGRKDALRHWVKRYWRALPGEKVLALQEQVRVIEHLRGKEKFNWQGLSGEILPSEDALRALRKSQAEMPSPRPRRIQVQTMR